MIFRTKQLSTLACTKVKPGAVVSHHIDFPLTPLSCWEGEAGSRSPATPAGGRGGPSIFPQMWEANPFAEMNGKWLKG